jgi:FixJ family two-component response regulator
MPMVRVRAIACSSMPGMSGIELLETMQRRGNALPVIVVSGRVDAAIRKRALAAGALAVVDLAARQKAGLQDKSKG